jgi:hypothetical protein
MTGAISNLAGSVSGAPGASKLAQSQKSRAQDKAERAKKPRGAHEAEDIVEVESADAVRSLKDETQEETQEDHQERPVYGSDGQKHAGKNRPHIDLEG